MDYDFDYSEDKNEKLKEHRGLGFEDIVDVIESEGVLDNVENPNKARYPNQRVFIVQVKKYAYIVPYVVDVERRKIFLKTIYPSRKATRKYLRK